ncbi:uncharacterized protein DS421_19g649340 [Arachis hypogaea]|uniref:Coenzyme Q-binding protein COQ10 START domain-containing protein n=1 Tax=Arachis hypogaea TaxID=3818 RepID=A0A6B9V7P6_ARAHY|nr:uncharacterized protein DS421_19g649340 [Arachis hypogaea]
MSSTATLIGSISTTPHFSSSNTTTRTRFRTRTRTFSSTPQSLNHSFFRLTNAPSKRASSTPFHGFKRFSPVMEWQDCTVKTEVDVPVSVAYACYSDREAIPNWMPFISSVKKFGSLHEVITTAAINQELADAKGGSKERAINSVS